MELLLEIGCEELPHDLLNDGIKALHNGLTKALEAARLTPSSIEVHGSARRLVALVHGLPDRQPDVEGTARGPAEKVALDENGQPSRAGEGFARSRKVPFESLTFVDGYLTHTYQEIGQPTAEVLTGLLPDVLKGMHWAKAMHWATDMGPFVRPVRWICALLDDQTVPFEFAGVTAGNESRGHRFLAPEPFVVPQASAYLDRLLTAKVMVKLDDRQDRIRTQLATQATALGGSPLQDDDLIADSAAKCEWPVVVGGHFDDHFLQLPPEVLTTSMRSHQDDFAIVDAGGKLLAGFMTVADNEATDPTVIAHGNERVLRARLDDARFFFEEDRKQSLEAFAPRLESFLFQKELGSVADRVARIVALSRSLAPSLNANPEQTARAATLCKNDLVCNMVYEFPELQGIMGRTYALADGEEATVAGAIEAHYLPRFAGDELPTTPEGRCLSIADKLDTLAGIFGVGKIPSGSQDPYGLRRQGLGVMRILAESDARLNLGQAVAEAVAQVAGCITRPVNEVTPEVVAFLGQRLGYHLEQQGAAIEAVNACLAAGFDDVKDTIARVQALDALRSTTGGDFAHLMTSFKRVMKIIPAGFSASDVAADKLVAGPEADLWAAFSQVEGQLDTRHPANHRLATMAALRPQVDAFFDGVLVMDPDEDVKQLRLSMLARIRDGFARFADFSRITTD